MSDQVRTLGTFKSKAFNTSQSRDYFINPGCFGDDVAKWLIQELAATGYKTKEEPGQEDFGWFLIFNVEKLTYCFVVGYRPGDKESEGIWMGWVERQVGFLGSILGKRSKGIPREAVEAIHNILSKSPRLSKVRWHFRQDFDSGKEDKASSQP